jgi:hypothetical protein
MAARKASFLQLAIEFLMNCGLLDRAVVRASIRAPAAAEKTMAPD